MRLRFASQDFVATQEAVARIRCELGAHKVFAEKNMEQSELEAQAGLAGRRLSLAGKHINSLASKRERWTPHMHSLDVRQARLLPPLPPDGSRFLCK